MSDWTWYETIIFCVAGGGFVLTIRWLLTDVISEGVYKGMKQYEEKEKEKK